MTTPRITFSTTIEGSAIDFHLTRWVALELRPQNTISTPSNTAFSKEIKEPEATHLRYVVGHNSRIGHDILTKLEYIIKTCAQYPIKVKMIKDW